MSKTWRVGASLMAAVWMVPASAAAGDGTLEGVRGEARGEPSESGTLESVRGEARGKSGKLDSVRDEVARGGSNKATGGSKRTSARRSSGDAADAADAVEAVGGILEAIAAIAEASNDRSHRGVSRVRTVGPKEPYHPPGFLRFPYADGVSGYIVNDRPEDERRWFSLSARLDSGFSFGGLVQGGFAFDMQAWRIGFDTELTTFVEPPSPGFGPDAMMLGSTSLRAAIIMMPFIRVRIGGGGQYLIDGPTKDAEQADAVGFEVSADADVFPVRPMVFSLRIGKGRLGGLDTTRARASVGVMIRRFELLAAYDFRRLGKVNLHGPGLGLRLWF